MNTAPFTVMDASAGSGKTRNLVKSVLLQALKKPTPEGALRQMMAITFTNKAAAEMKTRLLDYLADFSSAEPKETELLREIGEELSLEKDETVKRSKRLLKHVLHHYNDLSLSTIDSFTSRLIRTFSKDLALSENFEVILDLDKLLQEVTDQVIAQAGVDEALTKMLTQYVEQQLEDERSWNIDFALKDMAKRLMEEKHRGPLNAVRDFTAAELLEKRNEIERNRQIILSAIAKKADAFVQFLNDQNLDFLQLNRGKNLAGYIQRCQAKDFGKAVKLPFRKDYIEQNKWYTKTAPEHDKAQIDAVKTELWALLSELESFALEQAPFMIVAESTNRNMYALATLNALHQALLTVEETQNVLPLAEFNHIIHDQIKDEPAPYIFERLGDRYKHFFIDEFQDTSQLQWQNLFPLVENAIAGGGTSLIVGDAKQSIYRWRNGQAEQFIDLSEKATQGKINEAILAQSHPLSSNWRSAKTIVDFNNALFTQAAESLAAEAYKSLYEQAKQHPQKTGAGFVEVQLLESGAFKDLGLEYAINTITKLANDGVPFSSMALLTRSNKDGARLVQELTARDFPVISADSLLLGKAYEPNLLAACAVLRAFPGNRQYRWQLVLSLQKLSIVEDENWFAFAFAVVNANHWSEAASLINERVDGFEKLFSSAIDLYSFCQQAAALFGLNASSNAFVEGFLQQLYDYIDKEGGTLYEFTDWWEETGSNKAVSAPDVMNAIQVASIHKSKGLQYPVVIVPYVNWKFVETTREAWLEVDPAQFAGLSQVLVNLSKTNAELVGGAYQEVFNHRVEQEKFDNLNMLYVACTRAEKQLYLGVPQAPASGSNASNISSVIHRFLQNNDAQKVEENQFHWGEKPEGDKMAFANIDPILPNIKSSGWQNKVQLAHTAPQDWHDQKRDARSWGNLVHFVLAKIESANDVDRTLGTLHMEGTLPQSELEGLKKAIDNVIHHDKLKHLFASDATVYNERDIILADESRKRPDRLVLLANGKMAVVDYKTGEKKNIHNRQIIEYADLLVEAGFHVTEKHIVYINDSITIETL